MSADDYDDEKEDVDDYVTVTFFPIDDAHTSISLFNPFLLPGHSHHERYRMTVAVSGALEATNLHKNTSNSRNQ